MREGQMSCCRVIVVYIPNTEREFKLGEKRTWDLTSLWNEFVVLALEFGIGISEFSGNTRLENASGTGAGWAIFQRIIISYRVVSHTIFFISQFRLFSNEYKDHSHAFPA
jgi:hypothetical protein